MGALSKEVPFLMDKTIEYLLNLLFPGRFVAWFLSNGVRTWSMINASVLAVLMFIMLNSNGYFKVRDLPSFWMTNSANYQFKVAAIVIILIAGSIAASIVTSPKIRLLCGVSLLLSGVYQATIVALYYVESPPFHGFMFILLPAILANYLTGLHVCENAKDDLIEKGEDVNTLLEKRHNCSK